MSKKVENFIRKELEQLEQVVSPTRKEIVELEKHPMHKYC